MLKVEKSGKYSGKMVRKGKGTPEEAEACKEENVKKRQHRLGRVLDECTRLLGKLTTEAAGMVHAMGVGTGCKLTDVIHKSPAKLIAHTQLKNVSKQ